MNNKTKLVHARAFLLIDRTLYKSSIQKKAMQLPIGTPIRLIDIYGTQAKIGDRVRFSNTEGHVTDHNVINWDEINLCVCIGPMPFYKLMESAYIQSVKPGLGNFDFEIVGFQEPQV